MRLLTSEHVSTNSKKNTLMKKYIHVTAVFFVSALLISCESKRTDNTNTAAQETPKALQENKIEFSNYSRSAPDDLLEELYQELVDQSPELKKLEDELEAIAPTSSSLKNKFNGYESKSDNYYVAAKSKASVIADTLLKKKITALIENSNNKFPGKTAEFRSMLKSIAENDITLQDQHSVLKIVLTLPLIENFQNNNQPDKKDFKDLIRQQERIIIQMDSLTPPF